MTRRTRRKGRKPPRDLDVAGDFLVLTHRWTADEHTPPFAWCPPPHVPGFVTSNRVDLDGTFSDELAAWALRMFDPTYQGPPRP